jgi:serine/threonine protein phosphatase 1
MSRIYALGDIHGQLGMLRGAHALIEADRRSCDDDGSPVIHVGDLIDRGPDSRGVIQFLIDGLASGQNWVVLKGNHDRFFPLFLKDGKLTDGRLRRGLDWLSPSMGGMETLQSYGVRRKFLEADDTFLARARSAVPEAHIDFMAGLTTHHEAGELLFVHAGIRPGVPLEAQTEDDLIWIRDPFLWHLEDHPWLVVHGHTPIDEAQHYGNRVNLDTGAGYGQKITVAVFEGTDVWVLDPEQGRVALPAPGE